MTDVPSCPPHDLTVVLVHTDDRGRRRTVGRLCPGCARITNPTGGGFQEGSQARARAVAAAAYLPKHNLAALAPAARRNLETLRRSLRA